MTTMGEQIYGPDDIDDLMAPKPSRTKAPGQMTTIELLTHVARLRRKLDKVRVLSAEGITLMEAKKTALIELERRQGR